MISQESRTHVASNVVPIHRLPPLRFSSLTKFGKLEGSLALSPSCFGGVFDHNDPRHPLEACGVQ